jgi:acetyl-CoA acetyltransferase
MFVARRMVRLVHQMRRRGVLFGVATMCLGMAQGVLEQI